MDTICRSCEMDKGMHLSRPVKHYPVDIGLVCPLCNYDGEWLSHTHADLWGDGLECAKCHNYILYTSPDNQIYKDEIYLSRDRYLIRHLEDNRTSFYVGYKRICEVNQIIQFENCLQLENKIQMMLVFS